MLSTFPAVQFIHCGYSKYHQLGMNSSDAVALYNITCCHNIVNGATRYLFSQGTIRHSKKYPLPHSRFTVAARSENNVPSRSYLVTVPGTMLSVPRSCRMRMDVGWYPLVASLDNIKKSVSL